MGLGRGRTRRSRQTRSEEDAEQGLRSARRRRQSAHRSRRRAAARAGTSATRRSRASPSCSAPVTSATIMPRISHSVGRSTPDLIRLRSGVLSSAPDAVLYPGTDAEVDELLAICQEERIAVVPFGGGTSVVGGIETVRGKFRGSVCISLARLDEVVDIDEESLTATVQAGVFGPDLEEKLQAAGFTLGHFPQSFEFSTVGGWVATRSAGQQSTGYGRIDAKVLGLRCSTPTGPIELRPPRLGGRTRSSAADRRLRRHPRHHHRGDAGHLAPAGGQPARCLVLPRFPFRYGGAEGDGADRSATRISPGSPTSTRRPSVSRSSAAGFSARVFSPSSGPAASRPRACWCCAMTGRGPRRGSRRADGRDIAKRHKGVSVGGSPETMWEKQRFSTPYLRDQLLT